MKKIDEIPVNKQVFEAVQVLSADALKDLNAEAQRHLEYLDQSLRGVISRSWILVGWLVTLASSMVAVLVSQFWGDSTSSDVLIIATYGQTPRGPGASYGKSTQTGPFLQRTGW